MSDWHVLELDGDPTPGDPDRTRALARHLLHEAELAENNTRRLRSVSARSDELHMEGDYAPKYRDALHELPGALGKVGKAYRGCGHALSAFARSLETAKHKAHTALRRGRLADEHYRGALRDVRAAVPADRRDQFTHGLGPNDSVLEAAIADLDEHRKTQARHAAQRARRADHDRDRAKRLVSEAAKLRGDAERRCTRGIRDALQDSGIQDKSWWHKAWDAVSKPFRSWDAFVDLCNKIAMAATIVGLLIPGADVLVALALVAGAVVFADSLGDYAQGKGSLADVGLSALNLIPFKAGSLAKAGIKGVSALTAAVRSGEGTKLIGTALRSAGGGLARGIRNKATAIPHGFRIARQAEAGVSKTRAFARGFHCRYTGRDPVDMATGEMVLQQTDFQLPGLLPLTVQRTHSSAYAAGRLFGPGWSSTLDQRLQIDSSTVCLISTECVLLGYPHPDTEQAVLPAEGARLPLAGHDSGYTVTDPNTGHTLHFPPLGDLTATDDEPILLPLSAIVDRNGHRIDYYYDDGGILTGITHSGGYDLDVETKNGLITAFALRGQNDEPAQELIRYGYDAGGNLTEIINSSGQPLRFDYDTAGRMTRWTDRNGTEYHYTYDDHGRCTRTAGSGGYLDGTISYDTDNQATTETNSLGHQTTYHFNDTWQIERITNPLGHSTTYTWDRYDRLLTQTNPLGHTTRYDYDEQGNLTAITRPDNSRTVVEYNDLRLPIAVIAPEGTISRREYDERGNLTRATDPLGAVTRFAHDERGHTSSVTDALGATREFVTDSAGLPMRVTDGVGATTGFERDSFGRATAITDAAGFVTRLGWTVEGKLAWRTLPDGATERWNYDGEGNLCSHIDPLGQVTRTEITHFDLPSTAIRPDGTSLAFSYDTELRLISVTNQQGLTWLYHYDPAGNLVRETDFNGRAISYRHDAAGQLLERTNGAGETTTFVRGVLGGALERRTPDGTARFSYDEAGRLIEATDDDTRVTFQRDPLGRVVAETVNGRTVSSEYDSLGRRVRRETPSGMESVWEYDANDQHTALHANGRTMRFSYDLASREIQRSLGPAVLDQEWDANHKLLSQTITGGEHTAQQRSYSYRADGFLTGIRDQITGSRTFDLDRSGRVTTVQGQGWSERYGYDAAGNVITASWPAPRGSPDAEALGQREYSGTLIRRAGNIRYEHDAQGRMTLRERTRPFRNLVETWRYYWDTDDRMTGAVTPEGAHWRYQYDAIGRRVAKQRIASDDRVLEQVEFTWDGVRLAEQTHTDGRHLADIRVTTWDYEPGSARPLAQRERSLRRRACQQLVEDQFRSIVTDLVGSPSELVDDQGKIARYYRTTLWGNTTDTSTPLRFPGQYHDNETGLNYNVHRYYDPASGRYASSDPLGLAAGPNLHRYVANPNEIIDPLGLAPEKYTKVLYHGSQGFKGDRFSLAEAQANKRPGTPRAGVHLTHDFIRASQGYGREGDIVRVEVSEDFAESIRQYGGPTQNQLEYVGYTEEQVEQINQGLTEVTSTADALSRWASGEF